MNKWADMKMADPLETVAEGETHVNSCKHLQKKEKTYIKIELNLHQCVEMGRPS